MTSPGGGVIRPGAGDLVVTAPERIQDHAILATSRRFPEHKRAVPISGAFTTMDGVATHSTAATFPSLEKSSSA